jgi:hypothetical protein
MQRRPISRCWGIGLARTGTSSLCQAFRLLGYSNVLHNPGFEALASADAGADNGVVLFYKYLDYKFPGSKFILTIRDLNSWLKSMKYIYDQFPIQSLDEDTSIMRRMLIYETTVFACDTLVDAFERHHRDVRRYFEQRTDDLLEMNIIAGDGWSKLCPFLGLPIPSVAFPHLNRRFADI